MIGLIIIASIALIGVITVQIARLTEIAGRLRGEEEVQYASNKNNANWSLIFMVIFLIACVASALYYKNYMLGYGPHEAASAHGPALDRIFNITLFFTGIVFVITQIALFWFAYKYKGTRNGKSEHISHDNKLEIIWTAIPAVVMTFLVVGGLDAWNEVMADVPEDGVAALIPSEENEYLEIEATGYQFAWDIRYPGEDGLIGEKNFRLIDPGSNPLGQDWTDSKNWDDFMAPGDGFVLPVGKPVRVRITAKDVLHNFDLPHFRVKMDAIPGIPTYFVFTPTITTEEYREKLKNTPEYNQPDPDDPTKMKWETFTYELACAELCGKGHYSMRKAFRVVEEGEYRQWLSKQQSYYKTQVRGTENDPNLGKVLDYEVKERREAFNTDVESALNATADSLRIVRLKYVNFETGSANLTTNSKYELDNVIDFMKRYKDVSIELSGHTDNTGNPEGNDLLSQQRSEAVYNYLRSNGSILPNRMTAVGYGSRLPVDTNDTDEGRANNRRTEFKILKSNSDS
ncbi:MAG: OmpA family protein [Bacteroidota bacterium]